ncbi:MAG TPA: hypothetical protein VIP98_10255 [Microlunatus sp.]
MAENVHHKEIFANKHLRIGWWSMSADVIGHPDPLTVAECRHAGD